MESYFNRLDQILNEAKGPIEVNYSSVAHNFGISASLAKRLLEEYTQQPQHTSLLPLVQVRYFLSFHQNSSFPTTPHTLSISSMLIEGKDQLNRKVREFDNGTWDAHVYSLYVLNGGTRPQASSAAWTQENHQLKGQMESCSKRGDLWTRSYPGRLTCQGNTEIRGTVGTHLEPKNRTGHRDPPSTKPTHRPAGSERNATSSSPFHLQEDSSPKTNKSEPETSRKGKVQEKGVCTKPPVITTFKAAISPPRREQLNNNISTGGDRGSKSTGAEREKEVTHRRKRLKKVLSSDEETDRKETRGKLKAKEVLADDNQKRGSTVFGNNSVKLQTDQIKKNDDAGSPTPSAENELAMFCYHETDPGEMAPSSPVDKAIQMEVEERRTEMSIHPSDDHNLFGDADENGGHQNSSKIDDFPANATKSSPATPARGPCVVKKKRTREQFTVQGDKLVIEDVEEFVTEAASPATPLTRPTASSKSTKGPMKPFQGKQKAISDFFRKK